MKLLIVDDEQQIRSGLAEGLAWSDAGIDEVMTAENGLEAISVYREHRPELIITDIRMPGISGIELSRRILQMGMPVRIIVLSGYSEFSYAQEAIKLGVSDYLLKPIDVEELMSKVRQCADSVLQERSNEKIKRDYSFLSRQKEIRTWCRGTVSLTDEQILSIQEFSGFDGIQTLRLCAVSLDDLVDAQLTYALEYMLAALTPLREKRIIPLFQEGRSVILLCIRSAQYAVTDTIRTWQRQINPILKNQFGTSCSIAISDAGTLQMLNTMYAQAMTAIAHRLYIGREAFVRYSRSDTLEQNARIPALPRDQLVRDLSNLNSEAICEQIRAIFLMLREYRITQRDTLIMLCMELKSLIISSLQRKGIGVDRDFLISKECDEFFKGCVTLDGFEDWAIQYTKWVMGRASELAGHVRSKDIIRAVNYIQMNYAKELSLNEVANHIQKSTNYFSALFRREMGMNFVAYVNKLRIQEACRLMDTTDELVYEIALKVGFQNYKYFSSLFKQLMGYSPNDYRRGKKDKGE